MSVHNKQVDVSHTHTHTYIYVYRERKLKCNIRYKRGCETSWNSIIDNIIDISNHIFVLDSVISWHNATCDLSFCIALSLYLSVSSSSSSSFFVFQPKCGLKCHRFVQIYGNQPIERRPIVDFLLSATAPLSIAVLLSVCCGSLFKLCPFVKFLLFHKIGL